MLANESSSRKAAIFGEILPVVFAAITTIAMLGWLLWRCKFGFDFTDEGYYLNWISNPSIYPVSVTQFGFIYHPLYQLVGGDVALLRQSGLLISFGLAWVLCLVLLHAAFAKQNSSKPQSWSVLSWIIASATLASASMTSLVFSGLWLPTPSYNTLAFNAMLVAGIGVLLTNEENARLSSIGWLVIGVAGWLAFMAKPTTALALGFTIAIYLLMASRISMRGLAISISVSIVLLACSAWVIDGSIVTFYKRLRDATHFVAAMGGKHTFAESLRWDSFEFTQREKVEFWFAALIVFTITIINAAGRAAFQIANAAMSTIIATVILAVIFDICHPGLSRTKFHGLLVLAVPVGALLAAAIVFRKRMVDAVTRKTWAMSLGFIALPHAYAFGTGNNYWVGASSAGFFWIISGVVLLREVGAIKDIQRIVLQFAIGAQAIVITLLYIGMENPYRQAHPLRLNADLLGIGAFHSKLILNQESASYLTELKSVSSNAGFKPGMSMLDMTGHYPGSLYALGAKATGQAWMIGGYPGSEQLALLSLDRVECSELTASWILLEPSGKRKLSESILERYGMRLNSDYGEVARIHAPKDGAAFSQEQILYRPARLPRDAEVECQRMRTHS